MNKYLRERKIYAQNTCNYHYKKGNGGHVPKSKCNAVISKKDPEARYCAAHKKCIFPTVVAKEKEVVIVPNEKLIDFVTFNISCIDNYDVETL